MGATFCNLYCRNEQADALKGLLAMDDRVLTDYNGWTMVLTQEQDPTHMMRCAKKAGGDILLFFYYDDEGFRLTLFQNGKTAAEIDNGGHSKKTALLSALLPDDPNALKKLHSVRDCASLEESLTLLEETFGLPFYALYEQEDIPAVQRNEQTWKTVRARAAALRKRPNRYQTQILAEEEWPLSVRIRMNMIAQLRKKMDAFLLCDLFFDIGRNWLCQMGSEQRILLPLYIMRNGEKSASGYNTVIMADFRKKESITFSFPFSVGQPLLVNSRSDLVALSPDRNDKVVCLDQQGNKQWEFAPPLVEFQRLGTVMSDHDEIVLYSDYRNLDIVRNGIWRISPEDGTVITERILPDGECANELKRIPDSELYCYTYYNRYKNQWVVLDRDLQEICRYQVEEGIDFAMPFYCGHCVYTRVWRNGDIRDVAQLDLLSGEMKLMRPEVPVYVAMAFSNGLFAGFSGSDLSTLNLLDADGKLLSRHRLKDQFKGIWEENGCLYTATEQKDRFPGLWEDSKIDSLQVFRFADDTDPR